MSGESDHDGLRKAVTAQSAAGSRVFAINDQLLPFVGRALDVKVGPVLAAVEAVSRRLTALEERR